MTGKELNIAFKSYHHKMIAYAYSLGMGHLAEDIVADAFLKLFERHESPESHESYLVRLVRNIALNEKKHEHRATDHHRKIFINSPEWIESMEVKVDLISIILKEIESLGTQRKKVIKLLTLGYEQWEIAEILKMGGGTVNVHVKRFRDAMIKKLEIAL